MVFGGGSRRLEVLLELRDKFSAAMGSAGERVESFTDTLKRHRVQLLAVSGALTGVAGVSVKAASDLGEAQNKANVTFGEAASVIQEFAAASADAFGISRRAANEYTATLGNILQSSGLSQKAAAEMSVELTKLAADLASFNNIPIDEALMKLRSGLVGQAEPLRTVGVLLSEAALQSKALELGLVRQGQELTEGAKVQARYALILEQTRTAQGDFTRTSDQLANSTRRMRAQLEDAAASLGEQLIPAATRAVTVISNLLKWFDDLSPSVKAGIVAVGGITAAVAALGVVIPPVVAGLVGLAAAVSTVVTVVLPLTAAVAAAAATGWLLAASTEAVINTFLNWTRGTEYATNPLTIMRNEAELLTDEIKSLIMGTQDLTADTHGLQERMEFAAQAATQSAAELEKYGVALTGVSEKTKRQTRDAGDLDQKIRELSDTARDTTFLEERIMHLYEKRIEQMRIYEGVTSLAAESVWNIGAATQAAIAPLTNLEAALKADAEEIARMGREALATFDSMTKLAQGTVTGSFAGFLNVRNPTTGATTGVLDVPPLRWNPAWGEAPPGIPIINITIQGSVTTPDLTAIIAREIREIERRGF